ncbi:hypothetical protein FR483_n602R [Paramecium bursaria Chlorella virus FR483]|uniref:Uncharacterized protein n602R n=1 Tax=Paramecium bursaria Chlorella virus FR483 TaxID=399781 RepID=A7J7V6_PBCVF|nr:hypothetical protein FR483_n602R [Paramecium bursaria Chlorella virus FR483]ABT15887.1 hypothetical protein FR483_n602R [Paramecium bursaria Chlorella virus FR483]
MRLIAIVQNSIRIFLTRHPETLQISLTSSPGGIPPTVLNVHVPHLCNSCYQFSLIFMFMSVKCPFFCKCISGRIV